MSDSPLAWALDGVRAQTFELTADIPEAAMQRQREPGERHPQWILGHLLLADSYLVHLLSAEPLVHDFSRLLEHYGPASTPRSDGATDSKDDLVERLRRTNATRVARVAAMTAAELDAPLTDPFLARAQPTIGHHVHGLLIHEGYHAGQLSSWRRAHGFAPVRWTLGPG